MKKIRDTRPPDVRLEEIRAKLVEHHNEMIRKLEDGCKPDTLEKELAWEMHLNSRYGDCWREYQKEKNKYALA